MGIFKRQKPIIEEIQQLTIEDLLLGVNTQDIAIDSKIALEIPMVKTCTDLVGDKVASLPIKLYKRNEFGEVTEVKNDTRVKLLNDDTKDTVSSFDMKKNLVIDMLVAGEGYCYIDKKGNRVRSLRYVDNSAVTPLKNFDPIFKDCSLAVNGTKYQQWEFISLLNNSKDGCTGEGIVDTSKILLQSAYYLITNTKSSSKTSNVPKGVLESAKKLTEQAMSSLREGWKKLYSQGNESVIILNDGVTFKAIGSNNQQSQTNEIIQLVDKEICSVIGVPYELATGCGKEEHERLFIKNKIVPILTKLEKELDKNLLLEIEKEQGFFFAFDLSELLKTSMEERYKAYSEGIQKGFLQINEVRQLEKLPRLDGLDGMIKLNLADVLYSPSDGTVFTPNTGSTNNIKSQSKAKEVLEEVV